MKINPDFIKREIAGETVIIATGQASTRFNGLITLNDVGSFIWDNIEDVRDKEELLQRILANYEVDENKAREDMERFIGQLMERQIVLSE